MTMTMIDNDKMWASMLNYDLTKEEKERLGKALRAGRNFPFRLAMNIVIRGALREQGLMEKDGEIVAKKLELYMGKFYMCINDLVGADLVLTKGKVYFCSSDSHILYNGKEYIFTTPELFFREATDKEIKNMIELKKDKKSQTWIVTVTDKEGFHRQMNLTAEQLDALAMMWEDAGYRESTEDV